MACRSGPTKVEDGATTLTAVASTVPAFAVGQTVPVLWPAESQTFSARIVAVFDGSYLVSYDDGDQGLVKPGLNSKGEPCLVECDDDATVVSSAGRIYTMAYVVMAYVVMAYVVMGVCIVMACIVMAYMFMACIVMACIVMAYILSRSAQC